MPLVTGNTLRERNLRLTESLTSDVEVCQGYLISRVRAFGDIAWLLSNGVRGLKLRLLLKSIRST